MGRLPARVKGCLFCLLMFISSSLGVLFLMGPFLPLMFISPQKFASIMDYLLALWMYFASCMQERFLGVRIVVTGVEIGCGEACLLILNHRSRMDWMYLWPVLARQPVGLTAIKIVLKGMLKAIPGAGWAMQMGAFIFINRRWEEDEHTLTSMIQYYSNTKRRPQVVLFPEGTDFTPNTKIRSDSYALKNHLPTYDYVLHPRTTGFTHLTEQMRQNDILDAVYDITIAYPFGFPRSEMQLFSGVIPEAVHFHIEKHSASSLPRGEVGLAEWCNEQWSNKEERLKGFYSLNNQFSSVNQTMEAPPNGDPNNLHPSNHCGQVEHNNNYNEQCMPYLLYNLASGFFLIFMPAVLVMVYISWAAKYFVLVQIGFYVTMTCKGGVENFLSHFKSPFRADKKLT